MLELGEESLSSVAGKSIHPAFCLVYKQSKQELRQSTKALNQLFHS